MKFPNFPKVTFFNKFKLKKEKPAENPLDLRDQDIPDTKAETNVSKKDTKRFSIAKTTAIAAGVIIVILTVVIANYRSLFPSNKKAPLFTTATDITIALQNIEITPTTSDTLGVSAETAFLLKSKEPISEEGIKQNLQISPDTPYQLEKISDTQYKITPKSNLSTDNIYKFQVTPKAESTQSAAFAFQVKGAFRVLETLPRNEGTSVPLNSGIEVTFSHQNYGDLTNYFEISPKANGRFERHKRTVVFVPEGLAPKTLYTVTVKKGLPLDGSTETLVQDYTFQFETDRESQSHDYEREVRFSNRTSEFPHTITPALSVYTQLPEKSQTTVSVYAFKSLNDFIDSLKRQDTKPQWTNYAKHYPQDTSNLTKISTFKSPLYQKYYPQYIVFPDLLPEGYYLVEIGPEDLKDQMWLQINDLATYATTSKTNSLIWINDIETKKPVEGATIKIDGVTTELQTNAEGVAFTDLSQVLKDKTRLYLTITKGEKSTVIPLGSQGWYQSYYWEDYGYYGSVSDSYWRYLYIDRPQYNQTDNIAYWGMVKGRDSDTSQERFTLKITSYNYYNYYHQQAALYETQVTPSSLGTFEGKIDIKNYPEGDYSLALYDKDNKQISYTWFYVYRYVKPAYKIDTQTNVEAVFAGDPLEMSGTVSFFEGTPVPNLELQYDDNGQKKVITTDANGNFKFSYTFPYNEEPVDNYKYYPFNKTISVTTKNGEEAEISSTETVQLFGPQIYMTAHSTIADNKAVIDVQTNYINLDNVNQGKGGYLGDPINGQIITGTIEEYHTEKVPDGDYYDFINKKVVKKYDYKDVIDRTIPISITTNDRGDASYTLDMQDGKHYNVEIKSADKNGRVVKRDVGVYSRSYFYSSSDERFTLKENNIDQNGVYSIDDPVSLSVVSSNEKKEIPQNGYYLFYVAQRGLRSYNVLHNNTFDFKFESSFVPNISAKAIYFDGYTLYDTNNIFLDFKQSDRNLDIKIASDKKEYSPRDIVTLSVEAKDKDGKPKEAEVNLNVIDEAYYKVADRGLPNTLSNIYSSVGTGILYSYISHQYPLSYAGGRGSACFLQGTQILMSDKTTKNIENIKVGETILTKKDAGSPELVSSTVTKTFEHTVKSYLSINGFLSVTPEHILYVNHQWKTAGEMRIGDTLITSNDQETVVTSIESKSGLFKVYNLETSDYHTYFADGIYVHNEKGRDEFADRAYFGSVKTGKDGKGQVSFTVPDNITSWRVTYQGVTGDLFAGSGKMNFNVTKPLFVHLVLAPEYLLEDKPTVQFRTYGDEVTKDTEVTYTINIPTLGVENQTKTGKAFDTTYFDLPALKEGIHKISVKAVSGNRQDELIKPFTVYKTRLTKESSQFTTLTPETVLQGDAAGYTTVIFSDGNRGRFYPQLSYLLYSHGDRLDQKLARIKSTSLLKDYFDIEPYETETLDTSLYQTSAGGITLLPYSDNDLELSAKIAALDDSLFEKTALAQYFYKIYDQKDEGRERSIIALSGLAALDEPVLVTIQNYLTQTDLTTKEKLYLGLGLANLGDKENARKLLKEVLEQHGEEYDRYSRIMGGDNDDVAQLTALGADLASYIGIPEQDKLFQYLKETETTDILKYLEELIYISHRLPLLDASPVSFSYTLGDKTETIKLEKGKTRKLTFSPEELKTIKFSNINGNVGVVTKYQSPFDATNIALDNNISVKRIYSNNNPKEGDLVKVSFSYKLGSNPLPGCYLIKDYAPSGMAIVTNPNIYGNEHDENALRWYPYSVQKQDISFCVSKELPDDYLYYYSRIINPGTYKAETPIIQSIRTPDSINIGQSRIVTIGQK